MDGNQPTGAMTYPARGTINRILFKIPLIVWRLGFGGYLSSPARGGSKMLVLTTRGRKSGLPRHTMLSYILSEGEEYVASGWGTRSDWTKNILADPLVTVQARGRIYSAKIRRVTDLEEFTSAAKSLLDSGGDSHLEPWLEWMGIENDLDDFVNKRDRAYFFGFDSTEDEGPDPLPADLLWIWAVIFSLLLGLVFYLL